MRTPKYNLGDLVEEAIAPDGGTLDSYDAVIQEVEIVKVTEDAAITKTGNRYCRYFGTRMDRHLSYRRILHPAEVKA